MRTSLIIAIVGLIVAIIAAGWFDSDFVPSYISLPLALGGLVVAVVFGLKWGNTPIRNL